MKAHSEEAATALRIYNDRVRQRLSACDLIEEIQEEMFSGMGYLNLSSWWLLEAILDLFSLNCGFERSLNTMAYLHAKTIGN